MKSNRLDSTAGAGVGAAAATAGCFTGIVLTFFEFLEGLDFTGSELLSSSVLSPFGGGKDFATKRLCSYLSRINRSITRTGSFSFGRMYSLGILAS